MNKLEICIAESEEKVEDYTQVKVMVKSQITAPRCVCVKYFKMALIALEKADENVFIDALEEYLKEKAGE